MNRALRAATIGVLLISPLALSACSAGQVTQTASQERDKVGATAQVGDITLRAVQLTYPSGGLYEEGDDAELSMAIVNNGLEPDTLVDISGEGFDGYRVTGTGTAPATTSAGAAASGDEIEIPAGSIVYPGENAPTLTLTNLSTSLTVGQRIEITFTFERAGDITLLVSPATPSRDLPRGEPFQFHHEEESIR